MTIDTMTADECRCLLSDEGELLRIFDEEFRVKVTSADTRGEYAILSGSVASGGGPPLHAHPSNETFYVLSGEFLFTQRTFESVSVFHALPGSIVHAPAGVPHRFENVSAERSCMLMTLSPQLLDFLRDLAGAFPPGSAPDMEKMLEIHARHQVATFHGEEGSRAEPQKEGASSSQARMLAWEFEHANQQLADTLETCSSKQWQAMCVDTGWTVAVQAHHVASNHRVIANVIQDAAQGRPHAPLPSRILDESNDRHAVEFANISRDDVVELLRRDGPAVAISYRVLSDEQLKRPGWHLNESGAPTVTDLIKHLAIGEIERHGAAIREAIGS